VAPRPRAWPSGLVCHDATMFIGWLSIGLDFAAKHKKVTGSRERTLRLRSLARGT